MDGNSQDSDLDLAAFGFDASKQMTKDGLVQTGVTFAEGEALEDIAPPTLDRTIRKDVAFPKQYEKHVRVESDLIMETKQSDERLLQREA
jgi:hypothetical protein